MSEPPTSPPLNRLNVRTLARSSQTTVFGQDALAAFARLFNECLPDAATAPDSHVQWQARGEIVTRTGQPDETWLHLQAQTTLHLTCQRCLEPLPLPLHVNRSFLCVANEKTAAQFDDDLDIDVLICNPTLDLLELVEDELLMALPIVPHHEHCPHTLPRHAETADFAAAQQENPNPFAAALSGWSARKKDTPWE